MRNVVKRDYRGTGLCLNEFLRKVVQEDRELLSTILFIRDSDDDGTNIGNGSWTAARTSGPADFRFTEKSGRGVPWTILAHASSLLIESIEPRGLTGTTVRLGDSVRGRGRKHG